MKPALFVDTSSWYALSIARDGNDKRAKGFFGEALNRYGQFVSTNYVIGEAYTLVHHRWGHGVARTFLEKMWNSRRLEILFVSEKQEGDAYALLARYTDQDFSFVDGTSFVVMRANEISDCFTFDRHFSAAGFACHPS